MEITRLPEINDEDSVAALKEIKSYIIRLDRRLSLLLENIDSDNMSPMLRARIYDDAEKSIGNLKNEIIETAEHIKEIGDKIELSLLNEYVAKSEIGEYTENALHKISVDGKGVTQFFEEIGVLSERISSAENGILENAEKDELITASVSKLNAYIRTGKLQDGVYGIEIGNFSDPENAPYKVRLSDNRLSFYINNVEAAYFSDNSMYISRASIPGTLNVGSCTLKNDKGLSFTAE